MSSSIEGTDARGVRSESVDVVRCSPSRRVLRARGGDEERMPVEDVGTGVGYWNLPLPYLVGGENLDKRFSSGDARTRLAGRGNTGEEDTGSNAGKRIGVDSTGRFTPAAGGRGVNALRGDTSISSAKSLLMQDDSSECHTQVGGFGVMRCRFIE